MPHAPISLAQAGIWYAQQIQPDTAFTVSDYLDIAGPLDVALFGAAVHAAMEETESLRTRYSVHGSVVLQALRPASDVHMPMVDLRAEADPWTAAMRWMQADAARPVDPTRDAVFRMRLFQVGAQRYVWYRRAHHISADGYTGQLLTHRVADFYRAFISGSVAIPGEPLAPLTVLLDADREYRISSTRDADRRFWAGELAGVAGIADLSGAGRDGSRVAPHRHGAELSESLHSGLDALAQRLRTARSALLIAAAAAYLHRTTGARDIVIGLSVTARVGRRVRNAAGMAANIMPVRLRADPWLSLADLIRLASTTTRRGLRHQRYRYEDIRRGLGLLGEGQLYRLLLNIMPATDISFGDTPATTRFLSNGPVEDLSVVVREHTAGHTARVDFEANATRHDLVGLAEEHLRFVDVLAQVIRADPDIRLGRLDLERAVRSRHPRAPRSAGSRTTDPSCLTDLFEAQAARTPDAVAIDDVAAGHRLSYRELNRRANALAHHLIGQGIGPEDVVALRMSASADFVVSALAVTKAGAAYLSLDPTWPQARLDLVISDAAPTTVLSAQPVMTGRDDNNPTNEQRVRRLDARCAAYVIYTSGSTGRPKGVVVEHRSIVNYLRHCVDNYRGLSGATLLHSSPAYDLPVTAWHGALACGGRVVIDQLSSRLPEPYTFLKLTPSHLRLTVAEPDWTAPTSELVVGGEPLTGELLRRWREEHPNVAVVNHYGPTETTVGCLDHRIAPDEPIASGPVPIGQPIHGVRVYVLDDALFPVRDGAIGELYVAGTALARGYHGRSAESAHRFVADRFGPPGSRMYRTGDLVRRRDDGALEFVRRADDQVKIRGFRVEPGEVETMLATHSDVREAAVIGRPDHRGHMRLVGFVVCSTGLTPTALRDWLAARLPGYLVPDDILQLDRLPRTANGKLDRAALPVAERPVPTARPQSLAETALCEIVADLLQLPVVSPDDDFFTLGGDSISVIQLVVRAKAHGIPIAPEDVFRRRRITALAALVPGGGEGGAAAETHGPTPAEQGEDGDLETPPLLHRLRHLGAEIDRYYQAVTVQTPPEATADRLAAAVTMVVDHHGALRMRLTGSGTDDAWRLTVVPGGGVSVDVRHVDGTGSAGAELAALIDAERAKAVAELDPRAGRVVRFVWIDTGRERFGRLLIVAHHLVVDGVSWRILLDDLAAAWEAVDRPARATLAPVAVSVRRWAALLNASVPVSEQTLDRWTNVLSGPSRRVGRRPVDPRRDNAAGARSVTATLSTELTHRLMTGVTTTFHCGIDAVLLTALTVAVTAFDTDSPDDTTAVLVDVEAHGRDLLGPNVDLSRTIGWITTVYPVRLDPGPIELDEFWRAGPACGRALKRVKEQLRSVPDGGIGYGVARYLDPDTGPRLAALPQPQIGFNYLGRFSRAGECAWRIGPEQDALDGRPDPGMGLVHAVEFTALADDRGGGPQMRVLWTAAGGALSPAKLAGLAQAWTRAAESLARHAAMPGAGGHTPSDHPLVEIEQGEIDAFEAEWSGSE